MILRYYNNNNKKSKPGLHQTDGKQSLSYRKLLDIELHIIEEVVPPTHSHITDDGALFYCYYYSYIYSRITLYYQHFKKLPRIPSR